MKKYLYFAAALLMLASCGDDENLAGSATSPVEIKLTSSLQVQSRATHDLDTYLAAGEEVHVWVDDAGTSKALYEDNVLTVGSDKYTLSGGTSMFFPSTGNDVDIYAVHGNLTYTSFWSENVTHNVAADQQSSGTGYATSDLAYCSKSDVQRTKNSVELTFKHMLSKVEVVLKLGNGAPDIDKMEIINTKLQADFTPTKESGVSVTASGDAGAIVIDNDVTTDEANEILNEAIIVPQTLTTGTQFIRITTQESGVLYYKLPADITFAAGKKYHFTITVNLTELIVTTSITDWDDSGTIEDSASMDDDYTYTEEYGTRTYTVYSEAGLLEWSAYTRSGNWDTNCTLANDITLTEEWTAVGTFHSNRYTGTFDGNGKTITGLAINASSARQGLIGDLGSGGVVQNLTLAEVSITSTDNQVGAVVGYNNGGTVTHCTVSGSVTGNNPTGGVVGNNINGTVTACYSMGAVTGEWLTGGVVGNNNGTVTACYATGDVSGHGGYTSGVVGANSGAVTACYFAGAISGGDCIGGVAGYNDGTISTCYWDNEATYGIGDPESNDGVVKVDGTDVTWSTAATAMNETLTGTGWQYDGDGTTDPPLKLIAE